MNLMLIPHEFDEEMPVPEQFFSKSYVDSPPMLSKKQNGAKFTGKCEQ